MKSIHTCESCRLKSCFIRQGCSSASLSDISKHVKTSVYKKGQSIFMEGSTVYGLYFIYHGKVKVYTTGIQNRTQTVRLTKEGDIVGHRGYGGETYPVGAIALEDSEICFLENDVLLNIFLKNPKLTYQLMMYYSSELRKSETRLKHFSQMNVKEKVAETLYYLDKMYGAPSPKGSVISVELTRQDIADIAGINSEQLSRVLTGLKEENIISTSKKQIVINRPQLLRQIIQPFGVPVN